MESFRVWFKERWQDYKVFKQTLRRLIEVGKTAQRINCQQHRMPKLRRKSVDAESHNAVTTDGEYTLGLFLNISGAFKNIFKHFLMNKLDPTEVKSVLGSLAIQTLRTINKWVQQDVRLLLIKQIWFSSLGNTNFLRLDQTKATSGHSTA